MNNVDVGKVAKMDLPDAAEVIAFEITKLRALNDHLLLEVYKWKTAARNLMNYYSGWYRLSKDEHLKDLSDIAKINASELFCDETALVPAEDEIAKLRKDVFRLQAEVLNLQNKGHE